MTTLTPSLAWWAMALVLAAWLPPARWQRAAMAIVGATFLAASDLRSFTLLVALAVLVRALPGSRAGVATAVAVVVATMVTFKLGVRLDAEDGWPVVLGLGFYGLRLIHVAVDRAAGRLDLSWRDHFEYLFFLPTLIAGPLHRAQDFLADTRSRRFHPGAFAEGMERILYGLVKIVVLANWVGLQITLATRGLGGYPAFVEDYVSCAHFGWNLYFGFAGYSDLAIGLGRLVGYRLPENFDWPFLARNLADFWSRWHATLSAWCRDYVYTPLALHLRNPYLALGGSLLVFGLWHEISPRYCLWGAYHGLGVMGWRWLQRRRGTSRPRRGRLGTAAGIAATLHFVVSGFAFTSEPTLADGVRKFLRVASLGLAHI